MTAEQDAKRIAGKFAALIAKAKKEAGAANHKSGEELIRTAKVLIPVGGDVHGDGSERDKITGTPQADGAYLCDFGPKSKVIEGERGPRPFVNPALAVTRKRHAGRAKRAINKAVKEAFRG
jgi:hypothetical protein